MPRVSVCIPTYNTARYIGEAIESVLGQDYSDYELIICDNASTDETGDICAAYSDPRMRYIRFLELVGQAANWNRCLEHATADYVVILHADDCLRPRFLSRAVATMEATPELVLAHSAVEHIASDGSVIQLQQLYGEDRSERGDLLFTRLLLDGCVVNPAGVIVRRTAYETAGRFTGEIVWGVDWHMWLRLSLLGSVAYMAEPLAIYRQHPQSGTTGVMATARNGLDESWMINDIFSRIPADRTDLMSLRRQAEAKAAHRTWCVAEEMCLLGFGRAARAGIRQSIAIRPAMLLQGRVWGLWAATFLGYKWFSGAHSVKRALTGAGPAQRPLDTGPSSRPIAGP
jgi:glycosyltransferase involved in cell wall biosynthesis